MSSSFAVDRLTGSHQPSAFHALLLEHQVLFISAVHPVIAHHPITGHPYVNVSESFTRFIIGLSAPESGRVLTGLFDLIDRPEFHVRLRWRPNTLAIWDNRATQHYAVSDYLPHRRVMHRVAIETDRRADRSGTAAAEPARVGP